MMNALQSNVRELVKCCLRCVKFVSKLFMIVRPWYHIYYNGTIATDKKIKGDNYDYVGYE